MKRVARQHLRQVVGPQLFPDHVDGASELLQALVARVVVVRPLFLIPPTITCFDGGVLDAVHDALLRRNQRWGEAKHVVERGAPVVLSNEGLEIGQRARVVVGVRFLRFTARQRRNGNTLSPDGGVTVVIDAEKAHHAAHLVERGVERRAGHTPHLFLAQLQTAVQEA